jgi:hypothetical protein
MKKFNTGQLKYLWPRYLPTQEPLHSFLKPFHVELLDKLKSQTILLSDSGDLAAPKSLEYVPEKFTFNGAPMTISARTSSWHLSSRYLESDLKYLKVLGVSEMGNNEFILELKSLLSNATAEFKAKSDAWQSHLASTLMHFPEAYSSDLAGLAVVPLSDGTWVAARERQILFPFTKAEFDLPGGLELSVVHDGAASDPNRRKLFKFLGVGDFKQEPVVRHIGDLHANGRASSHLVSRGAIVSQIKFLYSVGWKNPTYQRFWFSSESGQRLHGSQLYQDSSRPLSASHFFNGKHRGKFQFIHRDYIPTDGNNRDQCVQ